MPTLRTQTVATLILLMPGFAHAQPGTVINVPADVLQLDDGTTIETDTQVNLFEGGRIGDGVSAGAADGTSRNVEVNIFGGEVGRVFTAHPGSTINVTGGIFDDSVRIGASAGSGESARFNLSGGVLSTSNRVRNGGVFSMGGGQVRDLDAENGSIVEISGGYVSGTLRAESGGTVRVTGGSIGEDESNGLLAVRGGSDASVSGGLVRFEVASGGTLEVTGGQIGSGSIAGRDSSVTISGGIFRESFRTRLTGRVDLQGGGFMLDGAPVSGGVEVPIGSVLTGVLADGSVFMLSPDRAGGLEISTPRTGGDGIADGTLYLNERPIPAPTIGTLVVASAQAPTGLSRNEQLSLEPGGILGEFFTAVDSAISASGGVVGQNTELVRSELWLNGGTIGENLNTHHNSRVHVDGGVIEPFMQARTGSLVELRQGEIGRNLELYDSTLVVTGGSVGSFMEARSGSQVIISGGEIGRDLLASGSDVDISGGSITNLTLRDGSTLTMRGGSIGSSDSALRTFSEDAVHFVGSQFVINGVDVTEGLPVGKKVLVTDWNERIAGVLADGSEFDFVQTLSCRTCIGISDRSFLYVTRVPEPRCLVLALATSILMFGTQTRMSNSIC